MSTPLAPTDEKNDPPAYTILNETTETSLLFLCDHASNTVPASLQHLGLSEQHLNAHIAWDIGAACITKKLSQRFNATAILSGYSRLVIDCNRQPGDPHSIPAVSDAIPIPANQSLSDKEVDQRADNYFFPYHDATNRLISHIWRHGRAPVLIGIHSFTPKMNNIARPWHIGVLWNHDDRLALPLLDELNKNTTLCIGENQPYSGRQIGYTMTNHGEAAGLAHVVLEIRQDLITTEEGCEKMANIIYSALVPALTDPSLHIVEHF